jgi:hypothetical protein
MAILPLKAASSQEDLLTKLAQQLNGQQCLIVQAQWESRLAIFRVTDQGKLVALWRGFLLDDSRLECTWLKGILAMKRKRFAITWKERHRRHIYQSTIVGSFADLCQEMSTLAPVWQGDGVPVDGLNERYKAVWTRAGSPFHLWRCQRHCYASDSGLAFRTRFTTTSVQRSEIAGFDGSVRADGLSGRVDVLLRSGKRKSLLRLRSLLPLIDPAYDERERDDDFAWVNRLAGRVTTALCQTTI